MAATESRVTIHMVASLDGFIARKDGSVDWLETADEFEGGETLEPEYIAQFLRTIDCYVLGSRTYETALEFEARGFGWSYGDTPVVTLVDHIPGKNLPILSGRTFERGVGNSELANIHGNPSVVHRHMAATIDVRTGILFNARSSADRLPQLSSPPSPLRSPSARRFTRGTPGRLASRIATPVTTAPASTIAAIDSRPAGEIVTRSSTTAFLSRTGPT